MVQGHLFLGTEIYIMITITRVLQYCRVRVAYLNQNFARLHRRKSFNDVAEVNAVSCFPFNGKNG